MIFVSVWVLNFSLINCAGWSILAQQHTYTSPLTSFACPITQEKIFLMQYVWQIDLTYGFHVSWVNILFEDNGILMEILSIKLIGLMLKKLKTPEYFGLPDLFCLRSFWRWNVKTTRIPLLDCADGYKNSSLFHQHPTVTVQYHKHKHAKGPNHACNIVSTNLVCSVTRNTRVVQPILPISAPGSRSRSSVWDHTNTSNLHATLSGEIPVQAT